MLKTAVVHTDNTNYYPITLYFGNIFSNGENYIVRVEYLSQNLGQNNLN